MRTGWTLLWNQCDTCHHLRDPCTNTKVRNLVIQNKYGWWGWAYWLTYSNSSGTQSYKNRLRDEPHTVSWTKTEETFKSCVTSWLQIILLYFPTAGSKVYHSSFFKGSEDFRCCPSVCQKFHCWHSFWSSSLSLIMISSVKIIIMYFYVHMYS